MAFARSAFAWSTSASGCAAISLAAILRSWSGVEVFSFASNCGVIFCWPAGWR